MLTGDAKEALRAAILEIGFDEARFTNLDPVGDNQLRRWLELGYHADMEWLKNSVEKRLDPRLVLEGAASALMLGICNLPGDPRAASQARWAKYALYEDYHDTVLEGLKVVGALLESRFGLGPNDYRYYVDTGPVMERGLSAASGLGWQGKNGMLISKTWGNWLMLATVLIRLEIEPDRPLGRKGAPELALHCGTCRRCIDACPTQAIVEPGLVDSKRCISYQTIENKGAIPRELRAKIGGRIYGCDICLDVCPWNRFAKVGRQQLLESRFDVAQLCLLDLLRMDAEGFRETFRKMPIKRTKLRGLLRNACIAAGNLREGADWWPVGMEGERAREAWLKSVVDQLIRLARHEEALVRMHAVWAVYRLGGDEAGKLLREAREEERDEGVLAEYAAIEPPRS